MTAADDIDLSGATSQPADSDANESSPPTGMPGVELFQATPPSDAATGQSLDSVQVTIGSEITLSWSICNAPDGVELIGPAAADVQTFAADTATTTVTASQEEQDFVLTALSGSLRSAPEAVHVSTHLDGMVVSGHADVSPWIAQSNAATWTGSLQSILFACPEMKDWAADPNAAPIKKGSPAELIQAVRGALHVLTDANGASYLAGVSGSWSTSVTKAVRALQAEHAQDDFTAAGVPPGAMTVTGQVDRATAVVIDQLLAKDQLQLTYPAVTVSSSSLSDDPAVMPELARRCIEVLRAWAKMGIPYSASGESSPFVHAIGFGKHWFKGTKTATCSPSTAAAMFWACGGMLNGKHIAHDPAWSDAYPAWQIWGKRGDYPYGCAGAVESLGLGVRLEASDDEKKAAGDFPVRAMVNKLRIGDLIQAWRNINDSSKFSQKQLNDGHSFFITAVDAPDSNCDIPGFTILTANTKGGVSEKHHTWDNWKELQIARLFKIDGEA